MRILLLMSLLFLQACYSADKNNAIPPRVIKKNVIERTRKDRVSIMTYNVENLFDTKDSQFNNDETFLPLALKNKASHKKKCRKIKVDTWRSHCLQLDWNEKALEKKMQHLAEIIKLADNGRGPDVLIFQEVENYEVLNQLRTKYLKDLYYFEPQIIEGKDLRGIDVAVMSRLETKGKLILHKIPFKGMEKWREKDSRGILEVPLKLPNGDSLTVFAVHLPAPFHPAKFRAQGLDFLSKLRKIKGDATYLIAAGDFNIPSTEDQQRQLLKKHAEQEWWVSHKEGCSKCKGTTYYPPQKTWSFLDMILGSKNFLDGKGWELDKDSIQVMNKHKEQVSDQGFPLSFDEKTGKGSSDHWPMYLEINLIN